jgi:hypothetical protein
MSRLSFLLIGLVALPLQAGQPINLENDILPILTRTGCNAGACHGKQRGQNGFQLSLLAFDPDFDFDALTKEGRGRRIFPASPEQSLLLRKATAQMPHGGGRKIHLDDEYYKILLEWIRQGTPRRPADAPVLKGITVEPTQRILKYHEEVQLKVMATYSDGSKRDVTQLAMYQSNESAIGAVNANGRIKAGPIPGEAAVMSRFMDQFAVTQIIIPFEGKVDPGIYNDWQKGQFIDRLVAEKWKQLNLTPSPFADDATFLRRVSLDVIGRIPTSEETRAFLGNQDPDRRIKLIDSLLQRPEYADYWANKWADLLRPNPYRVGIKAVYNLDLFLREAFRKNMPYDQFVREIVGAQGSTFKNGATVLFRDRREPDELTTIVSQLFLGIRLDCAKCHHHPFEVYGQDEFYSFAAYFARIGRKGTGLSPPISGSEEMIFTGKRGEVRHPLNNKVMEPKPLYGKANAISEDADPRQVLADWITSPDNRYFAKVIVNRVWAELMGRGLVDPIDDLRATNPPTNPALLEALADDFRAKKFDLKQLIKTIATSKVYALDSNPTPGNLRDIRNYSRYYRQRMRAEVMLDAINDVTSVNEAFSAMPANSRAMELWTHRSQSLFLDSFGRPDPNQDPPCERTSETSMVQSLHLMNAPGLHAKVVSDQSKAHLLASGKKSPEEIVDELYLSVYNRYVKPDERNRAVERFRIPGMSRRQATEDLLWAMLNTPEFSFKD